VSIFYLCPVTDRPIGGVKQIFRHVEALHQAGIDAHVLVPEPRTPRWFSSPVGLANLESSLLERLWKRVRSRVGRVPNPLKWLSSRTAPRVRVVRPGQRPFHRQLGAEDIIVVPEFYGRWLSSCGFGARIAVFNQNAHYTFNFFESSDVLPGFAYLNHPFAVLGVSKHILRYLGHAFPGLPVSHIPNGVDPAVFQYRREKKRQIAFMPRKLPGDLVQVLQILRHRGALEGWTLCPIDDVAEETVAQLLGDSAIFLSSCEAEGFGLPPLEAGACGCIVVGYTGYAADEFMRPELCFPIEQGNVLEFATQVERLMEEYLRDPGALLDRAARHSRFILERYSIEVERQAVITVWKGLLEAPRGTALPDRLALPPS
jgi:glycosyltransferase involved in cell wall biosynthesis